MVNDVSPVQLLKALFPIKVTLVGIVTDASDLHPWNALIPSSSNDDDNSSDNSDSFRWW